MSMSMCGLLIVLSLEFLDLDFSIAHAMVFFKL